MSFLPSNCTPAPQSHSCGRGSPSPFRMPSRTSVEWSLSNPVLTEGACAYESDTGRWKLGNGKDRYVDLQYQSESGVAGKDGATGPAGSNGINGQPGPPCSLTIGSVTNGPTASATITGTPPNQVLNLVLPVSGGTTNNGTAIRFLTQPLDESVTDGDAVVFSAVATNSAGADIAYKWQSLPANTSDQSKWEDVAAPPTSTLRITADLPLNGRSYRCVASSGGLAVTSAVAMLFVGPQGAGPVQFDAQPFDISIREGQTATFTAKVTISTGDSPTVSRLSWYWEGNIPLADGSGWSPDAWATVPGSEAVSSPGYKASPTLAFVAKKTDSGRSYRCVVTPERGYQISPPSGLVGGWRPSGATKASSPATLTVT